MMRKFNNSEIIKKVQEKSNFIITRYLTKLVIRFTDTYIAENLLKNNEVYIPKFGTFNRVGHITYFKPDFYFQNLLKLKTSISFEEAKNEQEGS